MSERAIVALDTFAFFPVSAWDEACFGLHNEKGNKFSQQESN
jgi:hypothetical protein